MNEARIIAFTICFTSTEAGKLGAYFKEMPGIVWIEGSSVDEIVEEILVQLDALIYELPRPMIIQINF